MFRIVAVFLLAAAATSGCGCMDLWEEMALPAVDARPEGGDAPIDDGTDDAAAEDVPEEADAVLPCTGDGDCDDGQPCTVDRCDVPAQRCEHFPAPSGTPCIDPSYCTVGEACDESGACLGTVMSYLYDVAAVDANYHSTCALLVTGGVKCWGNNENGRLGDGTTTDRLEPVDVSGLNYGVAQVSTGDSYACALLETGGVTCWGSNWEGQLGDGTDVDRWEPVDVSGLASGAVQVSAGMSHTCALLDTGGVQCWGANDSGQLGDGSGVGGSRRAPVDVSGLISGVAQVSAGSYHTCALLDTGGVKCWGAGEETGDGTGENSWEPVDVAGLASGVAQVSAGSYSTCALLDTGGVRCWGYNDKGQLGDDTTTRRLTPVDVSGLASGVAHVSASRWHACALMSAGGMKCWGDNAYGELGDGTVTRRKTPVDATEAPAGVSAVSVGWEYTCIILTSGELMAWGYNLLGQLGDGTRESRMLPVNVQCE